MNAGLKHSGRKWAHMGFALTLFALLSACSTNPIEERDGDPDHVPIDPMQVPQAIPQAEPKSRYGNPKSYEVFGKTYKVLDSAEGYRERGIASWYGQKFQGRRTSSGVPYDMFAMTAAHKTLPLPTYVRVTNLDNNKSVVLKVNDRGPFHAGRIIDLSYSAAMQLGVYAKGSAPVEVVALAPGSPSPTPAPPLPVSTTPTLIAPQDSDGLDALIAKLERDANATAALPFIQLGAFRKIEDCESLINTLAEQNLLALQMQTIDDDSALSCRILQGPFATRQDADIQAQALRDLGLQPVIHTP